MRNKGCGMRKTAFWAYWAYCRQTGNYPETGLWEVEVKGMFPVRLGIVGQLCVPFVCRSSSGSMGDGDRTSRLTVGQPFATFLR